MKGRNGSGAVLYKFDDALVQYNRKRRGKTRKNEGHTSSAIPLTALTKIGIKRFTRSTLST